MTVLDDFLLSDIIEYREYSELVCDIFVYRGVVYDEYKLLFDVQELCARLWLHKRRKPSALPLKQIII